MLLLNIVDSCDLIVFFLFRGWGAAPPTSRQTQATWQSSSWIVFPFRLCRLSRCFGPSGPAWRAPGRVGVGRGAGSLFGAASRLRAVPRVLGGLRWPVCRWVGGGTLPFRAIASSPDRMSRYGACVGGLCVLQKNRPVCVTHVFIMFRLVFGRGRCPTHLGATAGHSAIPPPCPTPLPVPPGALGAVVAGLPLGGWGSLPVSGFCVSS